MNYELFELSGKRQDISPRQFFFAFICMQLFYIFDVCKRIDYSPTVYCTIK